MKKLFTLLLTLITLNSFAATPILPPMSAELEWPRSWKVDSYFGNIFYGDVEVDTYDSKITLSYHYQPQCPEGMACIQAVQYQEIELPLISAKTGGCGSITYLAELNEMPVDGMKQTIEVISYTNNVCMHLRVDESTKVNYQVQFYDRINGQLISSNARLLASPLQ